MSATVVDPTRLSEFGARILESLGVPEADARLVAESLVTADLWGHASHGMLRLPWYAARLRSGVMQPASAPEVLSDLGAVLVMDGRDGVGQVVTDRACSLAVERAQRHGVGVVAVRNSNHFGTAAYWTRRMAERGCVGILTTNGSPAMAPWGGTEKTVGANPWSVATPGGSHPPVVLDIANTGVARGKIYAAAQRGEAIPPTWALDEHGAPTTDPNVAVHGLLAPMGGHKGYGISFVMDVLSGVLTGSGIATEVAGPYVPDQRSRCGHLVLALDIAAFGDRDTFNARIDALIDITKSVRRASGVDEIFYPGEMEAGAEVARRRTGADLPARTVADLRELGDACGVPFDQTVLEAVAPC
jgi:LDH2 family malate/lactate/ureidoglycolate dehydrogenase